MEAQGRQCQWVPGQFPTPEVERGAENSPPAGLCQAVRHRKSFYRNSDDSSIKNTIALEEWYHSAALLSFHFPLLLTETYWDCRALQTATDHQQAAGGSTPKILVVFFYEAECQERCISYSFSPLAVYLFWPSSQIASQTAASFISSET